MDGKHFSAHGDWTNMKPKKRVELKHHFCAKLSIRNIDTLTASEVVKLINWMMAQTKFLGTKTEDISKNYKASFEV